MSHLADGGQLGATAPTYPKICGALPCENDQAKPDPFSRLARSTNLSKILTADRLSGPFGSRPRLLHQGVLELVALTENCVLQHPSAFLREPSKLIELSSSCQAQSFPSLRPLKHDVGGSSPVADFDRPRRTKVHSEESHSANIKEQPANYARADRARRR